MTTSFFFSAQPIGSWLTDRIFSAGLFGVAMPVLMFSIAIITFAYLKGGKKNKKLEWLPGVLLALSLVWTLIFWLQY